MEQRATLRDVAARAGVSFKTVSNVVNSQGKMSEQTRQRVLAAIDELDYRPNQSARGLRLGRTGLIGLVVPDLRLSYHASLSAQVFEAAERRGLMLLIEQTDLDREREIEALSNARRRMTDGVLFYPALLTTDDAELLGGPAPLVLLGETIQTTKVDHVTIQNVEAAMAATDHLLELGHRRIAAIGARPNEVHGAAAFRLEGYKASLEAAGIAFDPLLVAEGGPWHLRDGARAVSEMLAQGIRFDAVFAFNDTLALGAMYALQAAGVRVPADVSVIGMDNVEEAEFSSPPLTTIDVGSAEIAEAAVDALVARIARPDAPTNVVPAPYRLVARGSTGRRVADE
jgi:DNA-binding LacI/PurR family transcriptional regulator